jgi:excisionase family DNA binding protein
MMSHDLQERLILLAPRPMASPTGAAGDRAVYTVREVAHLLSLSLGATYALVRSGEIPARRLGSRWVIPRNRFEQWLDECTVEPEPELPPPPSRPRSGRGWR